MKILFFVGKGGVGKSTNAALFGVKLAGSGKRILLDSIDPAHNLHDIFETPIGAEPREVRPHLHVMETDLNRWVRRYIAETERQFKSVYRYQQAFNLQRYFKPLRHSPGLEEYAVLLALDHVIQSHAAMDYIIFDTPPTALTLKFLALPNVSLIWLNELLKLRGAIMKKKEIITKIKTGKRENPEEMDPILSRLSGLMERYERLSRLLQDGDKTRIFIVMNSDRLSLAESQTIRTELKNLKLPLPTIVLNRYGGGEERSRELSRHFPGVRILRVDDRGEDVVGLRALDAMGLPLPVGEI